jgi:hypothetical protein
MVLPLLHFHMGWLPSASVKNQRTCHGIGQLALSCRFAVHYE